MAHGCEFSVLGNATLLLTLNPGSGISLWLHVDYLGIQQKLGFEIHDENSIQSITVLLSSPLHLHRICIKNKIWRLASLGPSRFLFTSVFLFLCVFSFFFFLFAFPSSTLDFLFYFSYDGYTRSSKLVALFYLRFPFLFASSFCPLFTYFLFAFSFFSFFVFFF